MTLRKKLRNSLKEKLDLSFVPELEKSRFEGADFTLTPKELNKIEQEKGFGIDQAHKEISDALSQEADVNISNRFLNITIKQSSELFNFEIKSILTDPQYLNLEEVESETIIVDYSGPNVAKRFSIGNLRSTIIGDAVSKAYKALGYQVEGWNHLGDWGTQFGKLIVAIKKWGNKEEIEKDPINQLTNLYVRFHSEAKENPELENEARSEFRKLEINDKEAVEIWKSCVNWSMQEFNHYYELLNIKIENTVGESFYNDKTEDVMRELEKKGLLKESEGAKIVELDNLPVAIIQKQDEAALYLTRDLASIKYRIETFKPKKIIYHVGLDQHLHFQQLFRIAELLGWTQGVELVYAGHGMVSLPTGKMSTREGNVVLLEDLIDQAQEKVQKIFEDKMTKSIDSDKIKKMAVSAIKYTDLRQNRKTNVVFDWDQAVSLNGNSGPYLQYTLARINSLIKKSQLGANEIISALDSIEFSKEDLKPVLYFKENVIDSAMLEMPNLLCNYAFEIATQVNRYYEKAKIISDDKDQTIAKIIPLFVYKTVLEKCFDVLGIEKLESI